MIGGHGDDDINEAYPQVRGVFALTAGLMLSMTASALEVHKRTDAQGVVHYSESPPPDSANIASVETLEVKSDYKNPSPKENYYSIPNQRKRLKKSHLRQERARAQREARQMRYEQQTERILIVPQYAGGYSTVYPYMPYHYGIYRPCLPHRTCLPFFLPDRFTGLHPRGNFRPGVKQHSCYVNPVAWARPIGGTPLRVR